jgi:hypothetical protein
MADAAVSVIVIGRPFHWGGLPGWQWMDPVAGLIWSRRDCGVVIWPGSRHGSNLARYESRPQHGRAHPCADRDQWRSTDRSASLAPRPRSIGRNHLCRDIATARTSILSVAVQAIRRAIPRNRTSATSVMSYHSREVFLPNGIIPRYVGEAGYIDARPQSRQIDETSCDARPDHTLGQWLPLRRRWQHVRCTQIADDLSRRATRQPWGQEQTAGGLVERGRR